MNRRPVVDRPACSFVEDQPETADITRAPRLNAGVPYTEHVVRISDAQARRADFLCQTGSAIPVAVLATTPRRPDGSLGVAAQPLGPFWKRLTVPAANWRGRVLASPVKCV